MRAFGTTVLLVLLVVPGGTPSRAETGDTGWTPPEDARAHLERILQDPVFQLEDPEPGLTQKIMGKVREALFVLFGKISAAMALNATLVTVLLWTVIVLALIGAGWLIIRLTRDRFAHTDSYAPVVRQPGTEPAPVRSPEELLAGAREALTAGDGRAVLSLSIQAVIQSLRRAGHLPQDRSLTDLEGARVLERSGPARIRQPFRALARSHDRLVYAGLPASADDLEQAVVLADGIVEVAAPPPVRGGKG